MKVNLWSITVPLFACIGLAMVTGETRAAGPKESKREMLSKHQVVAQFTGIAFQQCRGLTALCPDQCGGSGNFASFRVLKYLSYEKPGQYGDPKQTDFIFQVEDNFKKPKVSAETAKAVASLSKGDYVLLDWQHDYVTQNGSSSPERVCNIVQKISREEADRLTGGLDKIPPAKPKPGAKPGALAAPAPAVR